MCTALSFDVLSKTMWRLGNEHLTLATEVGVNSLDRKNPLAFKELYFLNKEFFFLIEEEKHPWI